MYIKKEKLLISLPNITFIVRTGRIKEMARGDIIKICLGTSNNIVIYAKLKSIPYLSNGKYKVDVDEIKDDEASKIPDKKIFETFKI